MDSSIKMSSKSRSVPPEPELLPPCRVCGKKASGLHYGANTCHGCKGFFRRSLVRQHGYSCKSGDKRCAALRGFEIKTCPYCRYQRCVEVGMSKQAIRPGRYTYTMRARNLQEARGLDESELSSAATTVVSHRVTSSEDQGLKYDLSPVSLNNSSPDSGYSGISPAHSVLKPDCDMEPYCVATTSKIDSLSMQSAIVSLEEMEFEQTIQNITDSHRKFSINIGLLENGEELKAMQEKFYELAKLKETMFGELRALSRAEYRDFFQSTGIDVDDRRKRAEGFITHLENHIKAHVQFAKGITGFANIALGDQCKLLKGSLYELDLFDGHGLYNSDLDIKVLPNGVGFHPREVCYMDNHALMFERTQFEKSLNLMDLSFTETALIKAIILLFTDRLPLDMPADADKLQLKIVNAFRHYLRKTNPNFKKRFAHIWNKIIQARTFSVMHEEVKRNCVDDFPDMQKINPLIYDMMKE